MADVITAPPQRRSSSQASSSSRRSQKAKTVRSKAYKRHSTSSNATIADLTSFPSLSPDSSPEGFRGEPALTYALSEALLSDDGANNTREGNRGRQAALDRLTSSQSHGSGRPALFDDSVLSPDIPGALHLADDAHIERLLERTGPVKLVRQFARDLAMRDAEISKLRRRADARERELKKMLREVSVSSQDIERRLYLLENPATDESKEGENGANRTKRSSSIYGLMDQAMLDPVGESSPDSTDLQATIRPQRNDSDARSGTSSVESGQQKRAQGSLRGWQDYLFGSTNASRKTSRASSVMSDIDDVEEDAGRPRIPSGSTTGRRKGLDEQLFQPPEERSESPAGIPRGKDSTSAVNNDDNSSIHSRKSSKSLSSWTVKLFAGNSQASKDAAAAKNGGSRASSTGQAKGKNNSSAAAPSSSAKGGLSAVAALKRINSYTGVSTLPGRSSASSGGANRAPQQAGRRAAATSVSQGSNSERNTGDASTNLGPVEMDAILPMDSRPPTLNYTYNNYQPGELLTDRFGFIYDQRRKKRQREATLLRKNANRTSMAETISSFRSEDPPEDNEGDDDDQPQRLESAVTSPRPGTPVSMEDPENDAPAPKRWQDYLKIATKPTELLAHTPSAGPIVGITAGDEPKPRTSSVAIDKGGTVSVSSSTQPSASTSTVVADNPEFANSAARNQQVADTKTTANEQEPVRMLLEQLTELHDALQRERTKKWNEFLRKVRAERRREGEAAAAMDPERANLSLAMPEASLADGEVVGIAGLGNKGKVGRAKWREFRALVLGGIPVAHRAKIWAECSGASAMRIPGYYDDLVKGVGVPDPDPSVVAQIEMDIHRTLTDNVFFRKGPGVSKLKDVLLAYSRRNPEVGYCQGMNLIAASLLLIMPTAEDAFWILASMIENILPQHYYDHGLLASRADQQVLRQYIAEVLPKLSAHLDNLGIELEALTFQWFLSIFTDCLSAEALYRVWDVVLCLNVTSTVQGGSAGSNPAARDGSSSANPNGADAEEEAASSGGGSTFLFQVALALLKLNEHQLLTTCSTPAAVYTYVNHQMTNHAISIDGLIQASEALRNVVRREDVVARRAAALRKMKSGNAYRDGSREDGNGNARTDSRGDS